MSRDLRDRFAAGQRCAWRTQIGYVKGGTVHRVDGLLLTLTNLPDQELNTGFVERDPVDPVSALTRAAEWCAGQGPRLALDMEEGRHRAVERAAEAMGMRPVVRRPAMVAPIADLAPAKPPAGVEILRVRTRAELAAYVDVQVEAFAMERRVAVRFMPPAALTTPGVAFHLARLQDTAVAAAATFLCDGSVGVFGVATVERARRRGIGTAITARAIDDAREHAGLAWLHATPAGGPLYERMGFRTIGHWTVWVEGP